MAAILLDTTVLIDALRGRSAVQRLRRLRRDGDEPCICAVNAEEVWRGLRTAEKQTAARLLEAVRTVPLGLVEGRRAGAWRRDFAAKGTTLRQADCLVAAAALTAGGRLGTGNPRHFPMPGLVVEHWPAGE
jgi:predicted nucleic acid-binding protein